MLNNMAYYCLYTSVVLVYGIGINRATVLCVNSRHLVLYAIKMLLSVSATATLVYLIAVHLLIPVRLLELFPFVAVLIFAVIAMFIESIVRITARTNASEFGVSMLCILLSVNESTSLGECVVNACLCALSFFCFIPFLYAIRKRVEISGTGKQFENLSLIFISVALIMIAMLVWNVSWLNPGVFQ
ncbi:MAG: hypothetical protein J1D88_04170 [Treponema sp.]|nr:hypothetical protein [Treponema sp.]